jgi:hypothetical protein
MTAAALLYDLRQAGVTIRIEGDALDCDGPADVLTDGALATIKARKPELIALLAAPVAPSEFPLPSFEAIKAELPSWTRTDLDRFFAECERLDPDVHDPIEHTILRAFRTTRRVVVEPGEEDDCFNRLADAVRDGGPPQ